MSEFVKKTALGGYKPVPGGYSDPDCTHVIMTRDEYDEIYREQERAERERNVAISNARNEVHTAKKSAEDRVNEVKWRAEQEIKKANERLEEAQQEIEYQERLNANLLRMCRERANADRKLRPKKTHTGYVLVSSTEREYRYHDRYHGTQIVMLWETTLQSPYSVDFTEEQARGQMQELIRPNEDGMRMVEKIGIEYYYGGAYEKMIKDQEWKDHEGYNIMLDSRLRANYRTGYWELIFLHTLSLGVVPKDMRAGVMGA